MTKDFLTDFIAFNSTTFEGFLESVLVLNEKGEIAYQNRRASGFFSSMGKQDVQESALMDFFQDKEAIQEQLIKGAEGVPSRKEIRYTENDGSVRTLSLKTNPIRNGNDRHHGTLLFIKDITEIKETQKLNRWLSKFPQNNPDLIFQTTLSGEIKYHNPAVDNFIAKHKLTPEEGYEIFKKIFHDKFSGNAEGNNKKKLEFEAEFKELILHFSYSVFQDDDEILISGTDVTHYVALEMENMAYSSHLEDIVNDEIKKVEATQLAAIMGIARLAETRDVSTGQHLERVREYTRVIAEGLRENEKYSLSLTSKVIELIMTASVLHDIGKVGIPDEILLKPGKFTKEEFMIITEHSIIGGEALEEMENLLKDSGAAEGKGALSHGREIAYYHHEKFDGSGYPFGISGEEIPISARIVSLADVFDALTSKRIYKDPFPFEMAMKVINEGNGTQFDPEVVEAFYNRLDEIKELAKQLSD